ncbi:MAG: hypothetical protein ACP5T5_05090 [Thermoprotei archaeon]|nr:hypothetical protein [TACK group archaeon]
MSGYDLQGFEEALNDKWKGIGQKDRSEAICAYIYALKQGMDPSSRNQLIDFMIRVGFACPDLGTYFAKYGNSDGSTVDLLASLPPQIKAFPIRLPFLAEKQRWTAPELKERLFDYVDRVKQAAVGWQPGGMPSRSSDEIEKAQAPVRQGSRADPYFYALIRLKGPAFADKVQSVYANASRLGIRGFMPFVGGAASSMGITQERLESMFEGQPTVTGKSFPDVMLELLSNADVDDYVVAYAYVLISEWAKKQKR